MATGPVNDLIGSARLRVVGARPELTNRQFLTLLIEYRDAAAFAALVRPVGLASALAAEAA